MTTATPEPHRNDLAAARHWLGKAAANLASISSDRGRYADIAANLGSGYAQLAAFERWGEWRAEDLERIAAERLADLTRVQAEVAEQRDREDEALNRVLARAIGTVQLPAGWRAEVLGTDTWFGAEVVALIEKWQKANGTNPQQNGADS